MPQTSQEERWRWIRPIINKEMSITDVCRVCPHGRRTLDRWIAPATEPKVRRD